MLVRRTVRPLAAARAASPRERPPTHPANRPRGSRVPDSRRAAGKRYGWVGQAANNPLTGSGGYIHKRLRICVAVGPPCANVGVCFAVVFTAARAAKTSLWRAPFDGGRVLRCGHLRRAAAQERAGQK